MGRIVIVSPADNTTFNIDPGTAVTGAQMPTIQAEARIEGETPDPTPTTTFIWSVRIRFQCSGCNNGKAREINDDFQAQSVGGKVAISFPHVRGGELTISVGADTTRACYESRTKGLKIQAVEPSRQEVNAACGTVAIQKMVVQESRRRQFASADCPLFSGDRLGGVGLLQITNPAPTDDDHWNWKENVDHGKRIFAQKQVTARAYPARVRASAAFQQLVQNFNAGRATPATIVLPDFTANELELDTIRGYNGWAGRDAFGNVLHEFRVPVDAQGNLVVTVDGSNRGTIQWQQVPSADRPQNTGDPNYVNNVLGRTP